MQILIVEDERSLSDVLVELLRQNHYGVDAVYDGHEGLAYALSGIYDLIILDIMLPKLSGLAVLHDLRKTSGVPVLMLTAIGDEYTQIVSFDTLADDYVTKPFSLVLLEKRVQALLRRGQPAAAPKLWRYKDLAVDFNGYAAANASGPIDITPREVLLLQLLVEHRGRVLSRERILDALWGDDRPVFDRTVDSHIKNLRKKLNLDCIATITGVGYKLEEGK